MTKLEEAFRAGFKAGFSGWTRDAPSHVKAENDAWRKFKGERP